MSSGWRRNILFRKSARWPGSFLRQARRRRNENALGRSAFAGRCDAWDGADRSTSGACEPALVQEPEVSAVAAFESADAGGVYAFEWHQGLSAGRSRTAASVGRG